MKKIFYNRNATSQQTGQYASEIRGKEKNEQHRDGIERRVLQKIRQDPAGKATDSQEPLVESYPLARYSHCAPGEELRPSETQVKQRNLELQNNMPMPKPLIYNGMPCLANVRLPENLRAPMKFDVSTKKMEYEESVEDISRLPIECPISNCKHSPCTSDVLSHMISYHRGVNVVEIFGNKPQMVTWSLKDIKPYEVSCPYILAYGGKDSEGDVTQRPVARGICRSFGQTSGLTNDLAIMVLCTKIKISDFFSFNETVARTPDGAVDYVIIIWLASHETTVPICYSLTMFHDNLLQSSTAHLRVRHLTDSQVPSDFLKKTIDYFYLTPPKLRKFIKNSQTLEIDIKINECDK